MIFIDADAFIAIHAFQDSHHEKALSLKQKTNEKLVTSTEVIFEVTTKLSFFTTHELACKFIKDILESSVAIEFIDYSRLASAKDLFCKQTSKRVSLTDCANMVIAKELGIKRFFSFDQHYSQNGFQLLI